MATKKTRVSRKRKWANQMAHSNSDSWRGRPFETDADSLTIYCDGSCGPTNPGPGGWSFLVPLTGDKSYGGEQQSTNNRMELLSVIMALTQAAEIYSGKTIKILSDSLYAINGCTLWMKNWKKNGWRTKTGDVKNVDLWKRLDQLLQEVPVKFTWVKGHNGNEYNEMADSLANEGRIRQGRVFIPGKAERRDRDYGRLEIASYQGGDGLPGCSAGDFLW